MGLSLVPLGPNVSIIHSIIASHLLPLVGCTVKYFCPYTVPSLNSNAIHPSADIATSVSMSRAICLPRSSMIRLTSDVFMTTSNKIMSVSDHLEHLLSCRTACTDAGRTSCLVLYNWLTKTRDLLGLPLLDQNPDSPEQPQICSF